MAKKRKTSTTSPDQRWYVWTGPDGKPLYCYDGCGRVANCLDWYTEVPLSIDCVFERAGVAPPSPKVTKKVTKKGPGPQERVA